MTQAPFVIFRRRGTACHELGNAYLNQWQCSRQKAHGNERPEGAHTGAAQHAVSESLLGMLFVYFVQNSFWVRYFRSLLMCSI